jgi:hypothetical protein
MRRQEGSRKARAEEHLLGHEPPVHGPFVQKDTGKIECTGHIRPRIFEKERSADEELEENDGADMSSGTDDAVLLYEDDE